MREIIAQKILVSIGLVADIDYENNSAKIFSKHVIRQAKDFDTAMPAIIYKDGKAKAAEWCERVEVSNMLAQKVWVPFIDQLFVMVFLNKKPAKAKEYQPNFTIQATSNFLQDDAGKFIYRKINSDKPIRFFSEEQMRGKVMFTKLFSIDQLRPLIKEFSSDSIDQTELDIKLLMRNGSVSYPMVNIKKVFNEEGDFIASIEDEPMLKFDERLEFETYRQLVDCLLVGARLQKIVELGSSAVSKTEPPDLIATGDSYAYVTNGTTITKDFNYTMQDTMMATIETEIKP